MANVNQYYYDSQIRRFIIQFIRIFSGWQVEFGDSALKTVPVMYGDPSKQAAFILKQNSENVMNTVPAIAVYVSGLTYDRKRIQSPSFVDKRHVKTRKRDINTGELTTEQGNAYTIERLMPVPHILKMKLDIWTSNTTQKLQILEQILTLFNPSLEIQSSDNYFDWTSLTTVNLESNTWDSRSVPAMGGNEISINTMEFEIPIWISPPAKIKKLGVIHKVVTSVFDLALDDNVNQMSGFDDNLLMGERVKVTLLNYDLMLLNGVLTLLNPASFVNPDNDEIGVPVTISDSPLPVWTTVIDEYNGNLNEGISKIVLLLADEINEVTGTITFDPDNNNALLFAVDIDTIPSNDLTAINAIIDPKRSGPGTGLVAAASGQRYMILDDIGDEDNPAAFGEEAWQGTGNENLVARVNDIIEYDGTQWIVTFDASNSIGETHFVTNLTTQIQYSWSLTKWIKSFEGEYTAGNWQLIL